METGVYLFLGMFFLGLLVLTVASIICFIRLPKEDMEGINLQPASEPEPDKPASLTAGDDDWSSGFGEEKPVKKRPRTPKGFRDRLFKSIIILGILDALSVSLVVLLATGIIGTHFRRNEELNDSDYDWYQPVDYRINGDGVIYDEGGIKITVSGIYQVPSLDPENDVWPAGSVKVGFVVENYSGRNVEVMTSCSSINGLSISPNYIDIIGNFRRNTTTQVYESVYKIPGNEIGSMIFDDVMIYTLKNELIAVSETPTLITTTAEVTVPEFDLSDYHPIFENDSFVIYACKYADDYHDGYKLYIENRTDMDYEVYIDGMTIGEKRIRGEGIYGSLLPAGNMMSTSQIYSYNSFYTTADPYNSEVMFSLYFKCLDENADDFSTGFMPLN